MTAPDKYSIGTHINANPDCICAFRVGKSSNKRNDIDRTLQSNTVKKHHHTKTETNKTNYPYTNQR